MQQQKLFGKYDYEGIVIRDPGLAKYISLKPMHVPHSFARHANQQFAKAHVNLVERLVNKLMRGGTGEKLGGRIIRTHGRLQGKKTIALRIVEDAFAIVETRSKNNPIQSLVQAVENSAPREDVTRVRFGGVSYQIAVDVSPQRRLDLALRNLALATIMGAFNNKNSMSSCLANEIILAAQNDMNSYSVKRKNEVERISRSAR